MWFCLMDLLSKTGIRSQMAPTYAYDISKAAVHSLTQKLANDFAYKNITVNAIAPGYVPTKMSKGLLTYTSKEDIDSNIPMGRGGTPEVPKLIKQNIKTCSMFTHISTIMQLKNTIFQLAPLAHAHALSRCTNAFTHPLSTKQDMAGAALYLSSRASAWVTGVILTVDGGFVINVKPPSKINASL